MTLPYRSILTFEDLNKDLILACQKEMEILKNKNYFLYDRIRTKMEICEGAGHIHLTVWVGDKFTVSYVIQNDDEREAMHWENVDLLRDLIQDQDIISSTLKDTNDT